MDWIWLCCSKIAENNPLFVRRITQVFYRSGALNPTFLIPKPFKLE